MENESPEATLARPDERTRGMAEDITTLTEKLRRRIDELERRVQTLEEVIGG